MHKITAALIASFAACRRLGSRLAMNVHAMLVALHAANIKAMIKRAEARVVVASNLKRFYENEAASAATKADEASRKADAVVVWAKAEAAKYLATL